jgi:hypothetical protein
MTRKRRTLLYHSIDAASRSAVSRTKDIELAKDTLYRRFDGLFPTGHSFRSAAEALLLGLLSRAAELLLVGQYPSVYVEIYAMIERFALIQLPHAISKSSDTAILLRGIIDRKNLTELASVIVEIGLWDANDLKWIRRLARIRNGLVHKNYELLDKALGQGREEILYDFDYSKFKLSETTKDLVSAVDLIVRLTRKRRKRRTGEKSDEEVRS